MSELMFQAQATFSCSNNVMPAQATAQFSLPVFFPRGNDELAGESAQD